MRKKIVNAIYIIALFLDLLCLSIPVLPFIVQVCAIALFVVYTMFAGIKINHAYKNWTLAYFSFFLLSVLWALKWNVALYAIIVNLLPLLLMTFATITYYKKNHNMSAIFLVIYITALLMLLYMATHIEEFVVGVRLGKALNEEGEEPLWNSNGVGISLCFAIFAGYIFFINQGKHWFLKFFFVFSAVFMIGAILLTGSRKSLLILLLPCFLFMLKKKRKYFFISFLLAPAVVFLLYDLTMNVEIFHEAIGTRIEDMLAIMSGDTTGNEDTSRVELVKYGINWFWDNPILGVGINNFRVLSDQTPLFAGRNFYAHNNYIELLVDVGIVGLFIYYSAYFYLFLRLRHYSDVMSIWGITFLIVLLFLGIGEVLYYEPLEQLMFCLVFCIVESKKNNILWKKN